MNKKDAIRCVSLLMDSNWAALATCSKNQPLASMVAYVSTINPLLCVFHLSQLARHTQFIAENPAVSLVVSEGHVDVNDPQQQARLSISGLLEKIEADSENYLSLKAQYIKRLPESEMRFGFSDFSLFVLTPASFNYVGGFARAYEMNNDEFSKVLIKSDLVKLYD